MDIDVVVETPQGSRNKYVVDPKSGHMRLDRMLFTSTVYPLDYGFVDGTRARTAMSSTRWSGWTSRRSPAAW